MLKLVLSLVIVFCGAVVGLYFSGKLRRRLELLMSFETLFQRVSVRIAYSAGDLCEVFSDNFAGYVFSYTHPFTCQWEEWLGTYHNILHAEDLKILLSFTDGLGSSDIESQQRHIELYRSLLQEPIRAAQDEVQNKGKLYRVLPISLGLVLSILII